MSKNGYYGDFKSFSDEERQYREYLDEHIQSEPDIVPCFQCGCSMYKESEIPSENYCLECIKK